VLVEEVHGQLEEGGRKAGREGGREGGRGESVKFCCHYLVEDCARRRGPWPAGERREGGREGGREGRREGRREGGGYGETKSWD